jgi:DUF1680 family protein
VTEPESRLRALRADQVRLLPSPFLNRFEANRRYLMELKSENLLQNHYFEAGIWGPPGKPSDDIHWGWEAPNSMVRGHFVGHWLAAAAHVAASTGDQAILAKANAIVSELARCQDEGGGEWVFSIPEKYLDRIARGRSVWAAQYIVSKTLMGLWEMFRLTGNEQALDVIEKATPWFHRWAMSFTREEFDDILDYETCGMLEVWADVYGHTKRQEHLDLMERYDRSRLFDALREGKDVLTNFHANTTIPEVLGAARAYEVTGEPRWREIVEAYWRCAVTDRGYYCTGGQTNGEMWTPPFELAARLGDKTQEHCTVYNMMRLAEYLYRWTGDVAYADYRERNLYNGILAQQHPHTGMCTYFLPMRAGSKKTWGTKTESFWCCYGTLVQANAIHGTGCYFQDDDGLVLAGYVPAAVTLDHKGRSIKVNVLGQDPTIHHVTGRVNLGGVEPHHRPDHSLVHVDITAEEPAEMALRFRRPWWLAGEPTVRVDGETVMLDDAVDGYHTITRTWSGTTTVQIELPRKLTTVPVPDRPELVAFMDGPSVLAGLCDEERPLKGDPEHPEDILVLDNEREWHQWNSSYRTVGQERGMRFVPIHDVIDETFSLYFPVAP